MHRSGAVNMSSELGLSVIPGDLGSLAMRPVSLGQMARLGLPQRGLPDEVNRWRAKNFRHLRLGARDVHRAVRGDLPTFIGSLYLAHISPKWGRRELGLAGTRVVTTVWCELIVDRLIASGNINAHNFHAVGTGSTAAVIGDSDMETEATTEYAADNTRPSGTQVEATSVIYRTVGTITVDAQVLAREHGILDNATVGSGILMDRTVFALVTLENGDSLQATYELTITAGG